MSRIVKLTKQLSADPRMPEEVRRAAELLQRPVPGLDALDMNVSDLPGQASGAYRKRNAKKRIAERARRAESASMSRSKTGATAPKREARPRTVSGEVTEYSPEKITVAGETFQLVPDTTVLGVIQIGCTVDLSVKKNTGADVAGMIKVKAGPKIGDREEAENNEETKSPSAALRMVEKPKAVTDSSKGEVPKQANAEEVNATPNNTPPPTEIIEVSAEIAAPSSFKERPKPREKHSEGLSSDQYTELFMEFCDDKKKAAKPKTKESELTLE